jgi:hypothetical protein
MKWLHPHLGSTTRDGRPPHAYMVALRHVAVTLDADPAWQAWWRGGGMRACALGIVAEDRRDRLRPSADIRRAGDEIRANFTCSPPRHDGRPADLCPLAVAEVTGMFEVIREAIGLPALPPVPPLPALPPNAPVVEVTTKPLPPVPRDNDQHGYQTLAQIQEFFA